MTISKTVEKIRASSYCESNIIIKIRKSKKTKQRVIKF